jgi:preprotein translocase subunit SecG
MNNTEIVLAIMFLVLSFIFGFMAGYTKDK